MEYHTPSAFDANGFNIMSPIVQNGGVGYNPTPSFKYNGGDPYQTQMQNQNYQYYSSLGQMASQQMQYYQNPQSYSTGYVGSYNPYYQQPTMYGMGYGYYNQEYTQQQQADIYREAYANGQMPLSDYCSFNGGKQLSFLGVNGKTQTYGAADDWYSSATDYYRRQQEYQRQQQEYYNQQAEAWNLCRAINNRYNGIDPAEAQSNMNEWIEYQQRWEAHRQKEAKEEWENDCLANFIRSLPNSTQKGYVSPLKEMYVNHWNNYYHQRNDKYPESYGIDEFFNHGIFANQILDDMEDDMHRREKELNRLYNQQQFRQYMHQKHPDYDPATGVSLKGARRLGIDDIEVKLPPNLSSQEYQMRRQKFFDSIMKDNRSNLHTKY